MVSTLIESLSHAHSIDINIKFTYEIEENGSLTFLGVDLVKNISIQNIEMKIYRKSHRHNNIISYGSNVLFKFKTAAYRLCVKRALQVCSEVYLNDELIKIKEIAVENVFSNTFISKLIYEYEKRNKITTNVSKVKEKPTSKFCMEYITQLFKRIRHEEI